MPYFLFVFVMITHDRNLLKKLFPFINSNFKNKRLLHMEMHGLYIFTQSVCVKLIYFQKFWVLRERNCDIFSFVDHPVYSIL